MEVNRVEIRPGVWLNHLREDKFKTACFSVSLLSQLSRETASMNALIPFVLRRGTGSYPTMEALNASFEELYGTAIEPIVRKIGEIQCCGFFASFAEIGVRQPIYSRSSSRSMIGRMLLSAKL